MNIVQENSEDGKKSAEKGAEANDSTSQMNYYEAVQMLVSSDMSINMEQMMLLRDAVEYQPSNSPGAMKQYQIAIYDLRDRYRSEQLQKMGFFVFIEENNNHANKEWHHKIYQATPLGVHFYNMIKQVISI